MNKKTCLTILAIALTLMALAGFTGSALAVQLCNGSFSYAGRTVQSCKDNYTDGTNWKGRMVTQVINGSAISKLGWHSWTDTRFCNGTPVDFYDMGSSYGYNRTDWASTSAGHPIGSCGGTNEARVYGNHYWEQSGYSGVTEAWSYWRTLP